MTKRDQIKDHIPPTAWKTELREHIEKRKLEDGDEYAASFVSTRQQQMRQEESYRMPTNVPLIQVGINPDGGHESVFVSPERVSMRAEIDRNFDLLSPTDMAALFNTYFVGRGCEPGYRMSLNRQRLLDDGFVMRFRRGYVLTSTGLSLIEEMLEFHTTVFRPIRYEETFLPMPDNIISASHRIRPLRIMERRVNVSEERRIPENIWKRVP